MIFMIFDDFYDDDEHDPSVRPAAVHAVVNFLVVFGVFIILLYC